MFGEKVVSLMLVLKQRVIVATSCHAINDNFPAFASGNLVTFGQFNSVLNFKGFFYMFLSGNVVS